MSRDYRPYRYIVEENFAPVSSDPDFIASKLEVPSVAEICPGGMDYWDSRS
jgi:hypothetical protein